jgi:hypothetical protein
MVILVTACFTPAAESFGGGRDGSGEVTFTVLLPHAGPGSASVQSARTASRSAIVYPPDGATLAALEYVVDFTSVSGIKTIIARGRSELSSSAPVGPIQIDVRASLGGQLYASGSMNGVIKASGHNYFDIPMYKAEEGFRSASGTIYADIPAGPLAGVSVQLMQGPLLDGAAVRTGEDGTWRVDNIAPGNGYYIVASKAGYSTGISAVFSVSGGNDVNGINLTLLDSDLVFADFGSTTVTSATVFDAASGATALQTHLNGLGPGNHVVTVTGINHVLTPESTDSGVTLNSGVKVSLRGNGEISLDDTVNGGLFMVNSGATLILRGPALTGRNDVFNTQAVVKVDGGELFMHGGSISGNKSSNRSGGVDIQSGSFNMSGGAITGNTAEGNGGGVYVKNGADFVMSDGTITENNASFGGGVYVAGTFTMSGGNITGNAVDGGGNGGGVYVYGGTLDISDQSSISGNTPNNVELDTETDPLGTILIDGSPSGEGW